MPEPLPGAGTYDRPAPSSGMDRIGNLRQPGRAAVEGRVRVVEIRPGFARLAMLVRGDMVNGHRICHGGMVFTLADSAFAFACNSYNESTVAAAASIDFLAASFEGDELTAVATELWRTRRNGIYEITVTNQKGARIALFRGRSYRIDGHVVSTD